MGGEIRGLDVNLALPKKSGSWSGADETRNNFDDCQRNPSRKASRKALRITSPLSQKYQLAGEKGIRVLGGGKGHSSLNTPNYEEEYTNTRKKGCITARKKTQRACIGYVLEKERRRTEEPSFHSARD